MICALDARVSHVRHIHYFASVLLFVMLFASASARAQDAAVAALQTMAPAAMPQGHMKMEVDSGWQLMQDGVLFLEFNHQSGPRGGDELVAPNWWMGMASRQTARGRFTFTGMLSLDPATVGKAGYRELFQAGEALDGRPLIDRQHPHDFFMQLAAVWRIPITDATGFTLAGGPVGEPALGPVAFMHRASAVENPTAPLGHHTFDSTHIAFGVVTAAVDHGPWVVEGSIFNGREPDENRWDFDFGRLDSFSGRLWYRPTAEWEFQISTGHLKNPEALEPGNIERSTASLAWTRTDGGNFSAVSAGYGRNDTDQGTRAALFLEGTRHAGSNSVYGRFEAVQTDTALLQSDRVLDGPAANLRDPVFEVTAGAVRDVLHVSGFEGGVGADVTWYGAPDSLQPFYGAHPVGVRIFFRLRPPAGAMGRMMNMRMSQPLQGHAAMPVDHPMP